MLCNNANRCSPMLIFRAWATCGKTRVDAGQLLMNNWRHCNTWTFPPASAWWWSLGFWRDLNSGSPTSQPCCSSFPCPWYGLYVMLIPILPSLLGTLDSCRSRCGSWKFRKGWLGHLPTCQLYRYFLFFREFYKQNFKGKGVAAAPSAKSLNLPWRS